MKSTEEKLSKLNKDLEKAKTFLLDNIKEIDSPIHIYTHLDADGLSSGAILGKALYRESLPFQITVLRQLEKSEIQNISNKIRDNNGFLIFCDLGSGQYLELQKNLIKNKSFTSFLILDHHLPQDISNKEEIDSIREIHRNTSSWHINPYFFDIDGSKEISAAGLCYYFSKCLNSLNLDLSPIAIVGAIGDIQNQYINKSFQGLNSLILEDAKNSGLIEVVNDLNFSALKPINEAIAYSSEIKLPGLTKNAAKTLVFLKTLGILIENSEGNVKTLNELNQAEKQKISSAIIEYTSLKLDLEPSNIINKLIINRYLLKEEVIHSELHDAREFSYLLNACGRTYNASLGIAIAMGDRKEIYKQSKEVRQNYRKLLHESLYWIENKEKIQQKEYIQYFFGENVIPESIIGTITSILILENIHGIDKSKPIFGLAKRKNENVYKVSGRAHEKIVKKGVNLSEAIREACIHLNLDILGGGHPPAAGTKIPVDTVESFLENCNLAIQNQLKHIKS